MALMRFMVEFGMNETALTTAIENRDYDAAERLILEKSHSSYLDEGCYHRTPLYMVLSGAEDVRSISPQKERNLYLAKVLIQHGARVDYRVPFTCFGSEFLDPGRSAIQLMAEFFTSVTNHEEEFNFIDNPVIGINGSHLHDSQVIIEDILHMVSILLAHSADMNIRYRTMQTVLHHLPLHTKDTRLFGLLVSEGADVNAIDCVKNTALLLLCKLLSKNDSCEIEPFIDILLQCQHIRIDECDSGGNTALSYAIFNGNINIALKLLQRGASPEIRGRVLHFTDREMDEVDVSALFGSFVDCSLRINGVTVTDASKVSLLVDMGFFDCDSIVGELENLIRCVCGELQIKPIGARTIHLLYGQVTSSLLQQSTRVIFQNSLKKSKSALNELISQESACDAVDIVKNLNIFLRELNLPVTMRKHFELEFVREKIGSYLRLCESFKYHLPDQLSDLSDESDGEYW